MTADRDDPPAEAVEAVEWRTAIHFSSNRQPDMSGDPRRRLSALQARNHKDGVASMFDALRTLPAPARWRLIGWLAEGLEPTLTMKAEAWKAYRRHNSVRDAIDAALTAARETSDAG